MDETVKKDTGGKSAAKKVIGIVILIAAVLAVGVGVGVYRSGANPLQEQLDLGQKYLDELNYEQALVAFEEAIRIDPKCVEAYLGMAKTYESMGNDPAVAMTPEEGYGKSLETYDRLLEQVEEDERALAGLGDSLRKYIDILLAGKQYDEVRKLAEKYGDRAVGIDFTLILRELEQSEGLEQSRDGTAGAEGEASGDLVRVSIKETDMKADSVFITDGYGSLRIQGVGSLWETPEGDGVIPPQTALVDGSGNLVFPYQSTYLRYRVSDGIVSLTESSPYRVSEGYNWEEYPPEYYNIDGSSAFATASASNRIDERTTEYIDWRGGPIQDGYALVIWQVSTLQADDYNAGISMGLRSYIIDAAGKVICTLPEEFNEMMEAGSGGFDTRYSLGWCGEGLFAVFEHDYDENWNYLTEVKGYMDTTGNMVLDLDGKGFTDLWPFHGGLAAVCGENGKIGFIDKTGTLVIPCTYGDFSDGFLGGDLCAVEKDGKWGYIDRDNNVVIPFEYEGAYGAGDGLASVVKDGRCGMVDYNNQVIVPLEYDDISSCEEGVAYAIKDGTLYIISKEG